MCSVVLSFSRMFVFGVWRSWRGCQAGSDNKQPAAALGYNANLHQILSFLHQIWRFIFVSEFASFIVQFWIKYIHSQFLFISASFFCKSESNFNSWFFIQKLCKSASFIFRICINFDDSIFSLNLHHLFCKSESNNSMTIFFHFYIFFMQICINYFS